MIMHVDMDAFFASVEQQVNPSLKGKPVIVGGRDNKYRSVICAASYEAKAFGIDSAMPSWEALKICPQAVFVAADTAKYIYTSQQIFEILGSFSPRVEKYSIDEFFIGVEGCEKIYGSYENMGRQIKKTIKERFGITCSIGVAPTKITAKLAAKMRKPDGLMVFEKDEMLKVMKTIPVEKICGVGPRLTKRFHLLGIYSCGELAEFPEKVLIEHFGIMGRWLRGVCRVEEVGIFDDEQDAEAPPKSVGHSQTLREVTGDQQFVKDWIYLLSEMVGQRLRRKGLQGRTVHFYISNGFEAGFAKQKTFVEPTYDGYEIYQHCLHIIRMLGIDRLSARVLAVSVSHLSSLDDRYLFEKDIRRDRLLKQMDLINDRFGPWTVFPASLQGAKY